MLRRLFKFVLLPILILLLIAVAIAFFFEKQIGNQVIAQLNKQLTTELTADEFRLSLLRNFPKASGTLSNVRLPDTRGETLLLAEDISFLFRPFSLFGSEIVVEEVVLSDATINVHTDPAGRANYEIYGTTDDAETETSEEIQLNLERAFLSSVVIRYENEQNGQQHAFSIDEGELSGNFSADNFVLRAVLEGKSNYLSLDGTRYLINKPVTTDAVMQVSADGRFEMEETTLTIAENEFAVDGSITVNEDDTDFDLSFEGRETGLEELLSVLPDAYLDYVEGLKANGRFSMGGSVGGTLGERSVPTFSVDIFLREGTLRGGPLPIRFDDVNMRMKVANGVGADMRSAYLDLERFEARVGRETLQAKFSLRNFENPAIDLQLNGAVPVGTLVKPYLGDYLTGYDGTIGVNNLRIKGLLSNLMDPARMASVDASGAISFNGAELEFLDELSLEATEGKLTINGNQLIVERFHLEGADSEMTFDGVFYNAIPVFLADSLNSRRAYLRFDAELVADRLDFDELMKLTEAPLSGDETPTEVDSLQTRAVAERKRFTSFLEGTFETTIGDFNYELIEGKNFRGYLSFDDNLMKIDGSTDAMDGTYEMNAEVDWRARPELSATLQARGVDIKEMFRQVANFGQEFIMDRHLDGNGSTQMYIRAKWDEQGNFLPNELYAIAGLDITNGYLRDFEMLEAFSGFVNEKDLKNIRFTRLQNWLRIENETIYLPVMFLQSNAANLTVSGQHRFDYSYDYFLKVNAGQILANKLKRHDPDLKPQKARNRGFNMFYKVSGTPEDFEYERAKKEVKQRFERSARLKEAIQRELKRYFPQVAEYDAPDALDISETDEFLD